VIAGAVNLFVGEILETINRMSVVCKIASLIPWSLQVKATEPESGRISLFSLLLVLILCAIFYYYPERPLRLIGSLLVTANTPEKSDGIVLLLGGDSPNRIIKAGQLYNQGIAENVVFSSGFVDKEAIDAAPAGFDWDPPSVSIVRALKSLGVPESAIHIVPASAAFDTSHELQSVAAYAKEKGWNRMTLVSTPSHTHRVSMVWKRVSDGISADVVPSAAKGYERWWESGRYRREVAYEYLASIKELWSRMVDWVYKSDHEAEDVKESKESSSTTKGVSGAEPVAASAS
jgi:uncharacterized SAM-binding protein YcdF (DUF218 family)